MYVCLCKGVTDHQIHDAVAQGCDSMRKLSRELGVATCCGKCAPSASEVLSDAKREKRLATAAGFGRYVPAQASSAA